MVVKSLLHYIYIGFEASFYFSEKVKLRRTMFPTYFLQHRHRNVTRRWCSTSRLYKLYKIV